MYNVDDLILNIDEAYKDCDDRLIKNYRKEFSNYSPTKLQKIWECIQENHNFAKAPELGNIFKYMNMLGIPRTTEDGNTYSLCTELVNDLDYVGKPVMFEGEPVMVPCNTKYSLRSKFCPVCNKKNTIKTALYNNRTIVKCNSLPKDLMVLNELCATCNLYQKDMLVRGSKCSAWGSHDEYKKSSKKCKDCPCFDCCNEKPTNGHERSKMNYKKSIKRV